MPRRSNLPAGKPGPGRPRGLENKMTRTIKDMVETALKKAGGAAYLQRMALEEPAAFLTLVGKLIPKDVHLSASEKAGIALYIDLGSGPVRHSDATALSLPAAPAAFPDVGETVNQD